MTKEAIEILKLYKQRLEESASTEMENDIKAFEMAIQSLSAEKTAEWKIIDAYRLLYGCSNCGQQSINKYRFCPWCGARMVVK